MCRRVTRWRDRADWTAWGLPLRACGRSHDSLCLDLCETEFPDENACFATHNVTYARRDLRRRYGDVVESKQVERDPGDPQEQQRHEDRRKNSGGEHPGRDMAIVVPEAELPGEPAGCREHLGKSPQRGALASTRRLVFRPMGSEDGHQSRHGRAMRVVGKCRGAVSGQQGP